MRKSLRVFSLLASPRLCSQPLPRKTASHSALFTRDKSQQSLIQHIRRKENIKPAPLSPSLVMLQLFCRQKTRAAVRGTEQADEEVRGRRVAFQTLFLISTLTVERQESSHLLRAGWRFWLPLCSVSQPFLAGRPCLPFPSFAALFLFILPFS